MKNKNRKGFTLFEMLIILGFFVLVGLGIYAFYSKVKNSNIALQESKNLNLLKAAVKNLYGNSQSYVGLNNELLNNSRLTPDNMRVFPLVYPDSNIKNSFGGAVVVAPVLLVGSGMNYGFRISYSKVPGEICVKLVNMINNNMEQITVNGVLVKVYGKNLDIISLTGNCGADTGNGVDIYFDSF